MILPTVLTRRAWTRAIMALKPAPYRFIGRTAKPSWKAKLRAQGIVSGLDWLLMGYVDAIRGPFLSYAGMDKPLFKFAFKRGKKVPAKGGI